MNYCAPHDWTPVADGPSVSGATKGLFSKGRFGAARSVQYCIYLKVVKHIRRGGKRYVGAYIVVLVYISVRLRYFADLAALKCPLLSCPLESPFWFTRP